jgi:hypothetical protein
MKKIDMPPWIPKLETTWDALWSGSRVSRWLGRWGVSLASAGTGVTTLFVFRRGTEHFPLVCGSLLLLWLGAVVLTGRRQALMARAPRVISAVIDYTVQTLLHGLLLFLLPIYYASTTLFSGNVWLLAVLTAATVLTTVDPWYRRCVGGRPWMETGLFGVGLFASLNVALPLIGLRSGWALLASGPVTLLALGPVVARPRAKRWTVLTIGAVGLAAVSWVAREWMPPVPLQLTRATFARSVESLEPIDPVNHLSQETLRAWGRISAFSAIAAPSGLRESITHVWQKEGRTVARVPLAVVKGGRPGGFRTYSWKTDLGPHPVGVWRVEVRTAHNQLIGRMFLTVSDP